MVEEDLLTVDKEELELEDDEEDDVDPVVTDKTMPYGADDDDDDDEDVEVVVTDKTTP